MGSQGLDVAGVDTGSPSPIRGWLGEVYAEKSPSLPPWHAVWDERSCGWGAASISGGGGGRVTRLLQPVHRQCYRTGKGDVLDQPGFAHGIGGVIHHDHGRSAG